MSKWQWQLSAVSIHFPNILSQFNGGDIRNYNNYISYSCPLKTTPPPLFPNRLAVWHIPWNQNVFRRWECNCQSWPYVSEQHILRSRQCCGIPAPSVWGTSRTHQNGTAVGKHEHSDEPAINKCITVVCSGGWTPGFSQEESILTLNVK